ncbi:MAG: hypothetical protein JWO18_3104 [Microbacteriaceae bacterium]|jgi:UTP:GlnB (protein PII) uridylyltransferase|nr:hypothetical protein [Microbacteriaceae bacterium]
MSGTLRRVSVCDDDRVSHWDWNAFASTTIATLIGAAISAFVGWLIFRGQRQDRYQERVSEAFVQLMNQVTARISALDKYKIDKILAEQSARDQRASQSVHVSEPDQWSLLVSMQLAIMVARGHDAQIMDAVRARIADTLHFQPDEEISALGNISSGISQYRANLWPLDKALERIRAGRQIDRSAYVKPAPPFKPSKRRWPKSI